MNKLLTHDRWDALTSIANNRFIGCRINGGIYKGWGIGVKFYTDDTGYVNDNQIIVEFINYSIPEDSFIQKFHKSNVGISQIHYDVANALRYLWNVLYDTPKKVIQI